jgi:hypothetical protein
VAHGQGAAEERQEGDRTEGSGHGHERVEREAGIGRDQKHGQPDPCQRVDELGLRAGTLLLCKPEKGEAEGCADRDASHGADPLVVDCVFEEECRPENEDARTDTRQPRKPDALFQAGGWGRGRRVRQRAAQEVRARRRLPWLLQPASLRLVQEQLPVRVRLPWPRRPALPQRVRLPWPRRPALPQRVRLPWPHPPESQALVRRQAREAPLRGSARTAPFEVPHQRPARPRRAARGSAPRRAVCVRGAKSSPSLHATGRAR